MISIIVFALTWLGLWGILDILGIPSNLGCFIGIISGVIIANIIHNKIGGKF